MSITAKKEDPQRDAGESDSEKPDIAAIMAEIRARIREDIEKNRDRRRPLPTYLANQDAGAARKAGELLYSEELRYLNQQFANLYSARSILIRS